jgi:hypothetical protein
VAAFDPNASRVVKTPRLTTEIQWGHGACAQRRDRRATGCLQLLHRQR